jgi:hypothetical protein
LRFNLYFSNGTGEYLMAKVSPIPPETQDFFRHHKLVTFPGGGGRWMTPEALGKAVRSHKADHWMVIDTDLDTGEIQDLCCHCATGIEHPNAGASSVKPGSSRFQAHAAVRRILK